MKKIDGQSSDWNSTGLVTARPGLISSTRCLERQDSLSVSTVWQ